MKTNMLTVTIGIPAYNEEANIKRLLLGILSQQEINFIIKEIIIISDGSNDKTDQEIQSIENNKITFYKNSERKGQTYCQNKILSLTTSDILILIEADTLLRDNLVVGYLVKPFLENDSLAFTQGSWIPNKGRTLIEKVLSLQAKIYADFINRDRNSIYWLCSGRGGRALRVRFFSDFKWQSNVPEDVFIVLWCLQHKLQMFYQKEAVNYYFCPKNLTDYIKERQKIIGAEYTLHRFFNDQLLSLMYDRPLSLSIRIACTLLFKNPLYFVSYLYIKIFTKIKLENRNFTDLWPITVSTKF